MAEVHADSHQVVKIEGPNCDGPILVLNHWNGIKVIMNSDSNKSNAVLLHVVLSKKIISLILQISVTATLQILPAYVGSGNLNTLTYSTMLDVIPQEVLYAIIDKVL